MSTPGTWSWVRHWTDLLTQDQVWQDAHGTILRLEDMDPGYCGRVRAFCLSQAEEVYDLIGMQLAAAPTDMSESATVAFDRAFDDFLDTDPTAWLASTTLLTALQRRTLGLPADAHTCHCGYPFTDADGTPWDHSACYPGIIVD